jgi:hypothetical protein
MTEHKTNNEASQQVNKQAGSKETSSTPLNHSLEERDPRETDRQEGKMDNGELGGNFNDQIEKDEK